MRLVHDETHDVRAGVTRLQIRDIINTQYNDTVNTASL